MSYHRNEELLTSLGEKIKKFRTEKGYSQYRLAQEANLERRIVIDIEKGISNSSISTYHSIAKALGLELSELMKGV